MGVTALGATMGSAYPWTCYPSFSDSGDRGQSRVTEEDMPGTTLKQNLGQVIKSLDGRSPMTLIVILVDIEFLSLERKSAS